MKVMLERMLKEAEKNIYSGVNLINGTMVSVWMLMCLFFINRGRDPLQTAALGGVYYISLLTLCRVLFKNIKSYLSFPKRDEKMPVFIGHKLDTIFTYPVLLMALIGIINNLLIAAGFFRGTPEQMNAAGIGTAWAVTARVMLLPLAAFAEELLNLLMVSFIYKYMKLLRSLRLAGSILAAALAFGALHAFGQGIGAAIPIGIAYIPVFFATLYTGSIWISFFAHLYNDLIVVIKSYPGDYYMIAVAVISLIPAAWAVGSVFRKTNR